MNKDTVADCQIIMDEVEGMIRKLRKGKSPGQDGILTEYIFYGGHALGSGIVNCSILS